MEEPTQQGKDYSQIQASCQRSEQCPTTRYIRTLIRLAKQPRFKKELRDIPNLLDVPDHVLKDETMVPLEDLLKNFLHVKDEMKAKWIEGFKKLSDQHLPKMTSFTRFGGAPHCEAVCAVNLAEKRCTSDEDLKLFNGTSQRRCLSCQAILEACKPAF